jgi:hypothetical protein
MTSIETTISSINLNVVSGPSAIDIAVDYGQRGDRGSLILYGQGKPHLVTLPETPAVYDMYINLLASDDEYQWVYQYISQPSGFGWKALFKLNPNTYSRNSVLSFVNGAAEIRIPITSITGGNSSLLGVSSGNFNVQHTVIAQKPIASAVFVGDISVDGNDVLSLPITVKASQLEDSTWSALTGENTVHIFITMV